MDVRHEEFEAMAYVFLGQGYDPAKRKQVEALQLALNQQQDLLYRRRQGGEVSPEEFLDASNALIEDTFRNCEQVLGPEDFRMLFGVSPGELTGLIDREAFLGIHHPTKAAPGTGVP